jgi:hypothetical protein
MIVIMRRGMPNWRVIAVAAEASGGEIMAPKMKPTPQGVPGIIHFKMAATVTVVNKTSPIARSEMDRLFALKSRHDVK